MAEAAAAEAAAPAPPPPPNPAAVAPPAPLPTPAAIDASTGSDGSGAVAAAAGGELRVAPVATGVNGAGWKIEAEILPEGALIVRWTAPRPIMEVKVGVGYHAAAGGDPSAQLDRGRQYTTKTRNRSNDPQPAGCMTFPASNLKRFFKGLPAVAACWDLDLQPVLPSVWTQPFRVEEADGAPRLVPETPVAEAGDGASAEHPEGEQPPDGQAAEGRTGRRVIGVDKLNRYGVRKLVQMIKEDRDPALKVLRLKQYLDADANPLTIDTVLDALMNCTMCEALYIQNFEKGMLDEQVEHLGQVLKQRNIWALNIGENFAISTPGWEKFARVLKDTHVTHMYASEPNFGGISGKLKKQMRETIRDNRKKDTRHKSFDHIDVICQIGQMWWNPRNHIIETPVDQLLGQRPTRYCCDGCRSSIAKDRMLQCSGKGCRAVFHMNCLDPPLVGWPAGDWLCPKCTEGKVIRSKRNNILEVSAFSVIGLPVKIAEKDDERSPQQNGHIVQRDPGNREQGLPDHFLVEFDDGAKEWCVLEELRCLVGGELVWARLPGLPWQPAQIFRHTALYPADHYRRSRGQQYVQVFSDPVQWAWVTNHSDFLRPFDPRFDAMERADGLGTLMLDDEIEVLYTEDSNWYPATVIETGHKGCNIRYSESAEWKECVDFLAIENINPHTIRRPKVWQDAALQLESALQRVESWQQARLAFAARPPSLETRDPSASSRRHKKPPPFVPPTAATPGRKSKASKRAVPKKAPGYLKLWADLTPEQRSAAAVLGYDEAAWTGNEVPPACCGSLWERDQEAVRSWEELSADMQEAAAVLGYESASWNAGMRDDEPPTDDGATPVFSENEPVYAMDPEGNAYNSLVLGVRRAASGDNKGRHEYLIHYQGWNSRWDQWMLAVSVFKISRENAELLEMTREIEKYDRAEAAEERARKRAAEEQARLAAAAQKKKSAAASDGSQVESLKEKKAREMREAWAAQAQWQKETGDSRRARAEKREREAAQARETAELAGVAEEGDGDKENDHDAEMHEVEGEGEAAGRKRKPDEMAGASDAASNGDTESRRKRKSTTPTRWKVRRLRFVLHLPVAHSLCYSGRADQRVGDPPR